MKKLMLATLFSIGLGAHAACVDFTGGYVFNEGSAQEVRMDLKQNACASLEVTSTQKGGEAQTGNIVTDGKLRKDGTNPYYLSSSTHTKEGLRLVDIYVENDVLVTIGETLLTKASNGDVIMQIKETDAQGEFQEMKIVGTKK